MQEQQNELLQLREAIIRSARNLVLNGSGSSRERLDIVLDLIRTTDKADLDVFKKAFRIAESLPSEDEKIAAHLDILFEVDQKITALDAEPATHTVGSATDIEKEIQNI